MAFDIESFSSLDVAVSKLNKAITTASGHHIPAGYVRNFSPIFTPEINALKRQRKHLRAQAPTSDRVRRLTELNEQIANKIREHQDAQ